MDIRLKYWAAYFLDKYSLEPPDMHNRYDLSVSHRDILVQGNDTLLLDD